MASIGSVRSGGGQDASVRPAKTRTQQEQEAQDQRRRAELDVRKVLQRGNSAANANTQIDILA